MQSIQLTRVLKQLLESHSVVTLPGLGRFRVYLCPARFKPYAGVFRPATREVIFEKGDFADDQLLSTAVTEQLGLYSQDAQVQVQECIKEWSILLHRNQFVELPELGTLYFGAKAKLYFKLQEGIVLPVDESLLTEEQMHPELSPKKAEKETVILKHGKWWVMITAAILLGSGLYLYFSFRKVDEQPMWSNLQQKAVPEQKIVPKDTVAVPDTTRKDTLKPKETRFKIHIVTGSAVSKSTALAQQKDYKRKGIKTALLTMKKGRYLLSLGLYRTREEAESALPVQKRKIRSARIIEL